MHIVVINENEVQFNGRTYKRYVNSVIASTRNYFRGGKSLLHRDVWEYHNGPIPDGYVVHHKDENKLNNDISNLEAIPDRNHRQYHSPNFVEKSTEWHQSEQGRLQHSEQGKELWENRDPVKAVCEFCSNTYETFFPERTRVCSNNCKSALRRKEGVDNEDRICKTCNETFSTNKYSKILCCGRECSKAYYRQKKLEAQAKAAEEQSSNNI